MVDFWDEYEEELREIENAINRIPDLFKFLNEIGKSFWTYDGEDEIDISNKIMIGCIQREIEFLSQKVDQIFQEIKEIKDKYAVVKAGEKNWRPFRKIKGKQVFISEAGDIEEVPIELLRMLKTNVDLTIDIKSRNSKVEFIDGAGRTICIIPKSLMVMLEKLLKEIDI